MKEFVNGILGASGEQWAGFIVLSFLASMLALTVIAVSSDHKIECQYMSAYGVDGITQYRIMNQVNWMGDTKAFSSVDANETLAVFSTINNKCPIK